MVVSEVSTVNLPMDIVPKKEFLVYGYPCSVQFRKEAKECLGRGCLEMVEESLWNGDDLLLVI
jgi:hypothetical protein